MKLSAALILAAISLVSAAPANDWSKPCFNGECAYDLPGHQGSSGVLRITGSPMAITDITSAAGWVILDCDPSSLEQEIRLVCQNDDADASKCNHIFEHWGAEDKIVRLPESCGSGPFARIAQATVAKDQAIPSHVEGKITRRDGVPPQVHLLKIDTNYAAIDAAKVGDIRFGFVGVTHPDADINFALADGWFDGAINWVSGAAKTVGGAVSGAANDVGKAVSGAANDVGKAVSTAAKDVGKAAESAGKAVAHVAGAAFQAIKDVPGLLENATHFEFRPTVATSPVDLRGSATLVDFHQTGCSAVTGKLKVDVDGRGNGQAKAGVVIDGSIVPPKIKELAAFAGLSFDVDATLHVDASISGGYDTGRKSIIKPIGLPGFSIPGILTIGPFVELEAQAQAFLELNIDTSVHLAYKVDDLELWYPPTAKPSTHKGIHTKQSPLKLKAHASADAQGFIEGHLIPSLKLGVSALGGKGKADIFLEADAFARVSVKAEGHVNANVASAPAAGGKPAKKGKGKRDYVPPYGTHARDLAIVTSGLSSRNADDVKAGFSGCIWVDCGLELRYGAEAKAFDLWSANAHGPLWTSPIWPIWSTCFAAGTKKPGKSGNSPFDRNTFLAKVNAKKVQCAAVDNSQLESVPDDSIPEKTVVP